jgi:stage II sporulation protein P
MKKLRYISGLMSAFVCFAAITLSSDSGNLMPYIAGAVLNEIIPQALCGQDISSVVLCEILPGCMVGYTDDTAYDYGSFYAEMSVSYSTEAEESLSSSDVTAVVQQTEDTTAYSTDETTAASSESGTASESASESEAAADVMAVAITDGMVSGPAPINYSMSQLLDFETLLSECYVVDSSTTVTQDELDVEKLLSMDMGIDTSGDEIKVLIYHTHGSETFADSRDGVLEDTVIGVGDELAQLLENTYGIRVYHDRTIYDNVNGVTDRSNAYNLAGVAIDKILEENPGIEVVLDLHRDGVNDELKLVRTVDGRETAQIMFLNGVSRLKSSGDIEYLYNPHKEENLSFSLKLFLNGRSLYGDLIRKIYIRGYCFNLDRVARSSLIEVGAQTNTVEEAKNAMIPLARIINQVLSE